MASRRDGALDARADGSRLGAGARADGSRLGAGARADGSRPRADAPADGGRPGTLTRLTRRQREVATLVAEGHSNRQIANALTLTEGTVANHVRRILSLSGARSRAELAGWLGAPWRVLPDAVPDALLSVAADGTCLAVNAAAAAMLGRDDVAGLAVVELAVDRHAWATAWHELTRQDRWRGELVLKRPDRRELPVDVTSCAVPAPDGLVYCLALRAIAERGRSTAALPARLLLSRELRGPLAAIRGYAQLLERRTAEPIAALIVEQADRLVRLIEDLVDVAGAGDAGPSLCRARVDLTALAHQAIDQVRGLFTGHTFRVEAPAEPIEGEWDADRLARGLAQLIAHAATDATEGGPIVARVWADPATAYVSLTSQSVRIQGAALPRIVDLADHAERPASPAVPGLGIELFVGRAVIEAHGGHIEMCPDVGRGSAFTVSLPREVPAAPKTSLLDPRQDGHHPR